MAKIITLVSGGLDSTILYKLHGGQPVFIDYGQPYLQKELAAVRRIVAPDELEILHVSGHTPVTEGDFIPSRNLFFATLVTLRYSPDIIMMAGLRDDKVEDKNPAAFREMSKILTSFSRKNILVTSPFFHLSKGQIVELYMLEFGDHSLLSHVVSCYSGESGTACLNCPACFRKFVALTTNGIPVSLVSREIVISYLPKLHTYDRDRISRTIIAIRPYFKNVMAVDIDGVLCKLEPGYDYRNRQPLVEAIEKVNRYYADNNLILLYTSRLNSDREITTQWLAEHGVKYHSLFTNKIPYDVIWDDRSQQNE